MAIVCVTGAREGAGKSTVSLNLALAWAGTRSRQTLVVLVDPLRRDDISAPLGLSGRLEPKHLGRLAVSSWGVGTVTLPVHPRAGLKTVHGLAREFELILDVEPCSPLLPACLELADLTLWVCRPDLSHLNASLQAYPTVVERSRGSVELVINQADAPWALPPAQLDHLCGLLRPRARYDMPFDELLPLLANLGRLLVVERPQAPWVDALRPVLGRVLELD